MSKYYNLKNFNSDKKFHFILESKIEKIDKILFNCYESDCGIGKENYNYIMRFINNQQKEIEELKSIASEFTNRNIEQFSIGEFNFKVKHFKDNYIYKDKIREVIGKYIDIQEHLKYNNQEIYGEDLKNMINDLLEEE